MSTHIRFAHDDAKSWCGKSIGDEKHFKNVEAAVLNGMHFGEPKACNECTSVIIGHLQSGITFEYKEEKQS